MSTIKCPNCGHTLPEDSAFCNKCGSRIEMYDDDRRRQQKRDYEDWDDEPRERRSSNQSNDSKGSNKTMMTIVGIAVAAFISIFALNKCFFSGNHNDNGQDSISSVDQSNSAAADALQRALTENNYVGDGARIVYAKRISGTEPGTNDMIIGITQLADRNGESFFKLYELTQNGEKWKIDPEHIQTVLTTGYDVSFDTGQLKTDINFAPQAPEIGGKKYFFYAYLKRPKSNTGNSSVVLNLYDIQSRSTTTATYEGAFEDVNGERAIVCDPASGNSETVRWMNEQARNFIHILSFKGSNNLLGDETKPTEPTTPQDQQATQPTEEQKPAATTQASVGEEKDKDSPMFKKEDIVETKEAGNYKVFRLKDGSVVRYDRTTGKNTKIHQGGAEAIGFEDTKKGILNIRKSDGSREQVNLNNGQKTSKPAAAPAEKKEEPAKQP